MTEAIAPCPAYGFEVLSFPNTEAVALIGPLQRLNETCEQVIVANEHL